MIVRYSFDWDISFGGFWWGKVFLGLSFYAIPFLMTIIILLWQGKKLSVFKQKEFIFLILSVLLVLWVNQYALIYKNLKGLFPIYSHYYFEKISFNIHISFFYLLIPWLYGLYFKPASYESFYGLSRQGFKISPYLWMLLIMLPLLFWASFREDFLLAYPRYKPGLVEVNTGVSAWVTVLIYELTYVLQFVALEIFFRGFIVLNLGRFMGSSAVFPMVTVYMLIHFYKPMPETLGSIFGGFTLGVISWYSKSVWGGVLVHIGIALGMELLGFWQMSG